jgi:dihydropteroate synthase
MIADGAAIIDIGGESTRPGASPVSVDEELRRVLPVVEALASRCLVSVDTRKPQVARACIRAGAAIVNDVSGDLWPVAADLGAGWVAMHMRGAPATMQADPQYEDVVDQVLDYLIDRADIARAAGVSDIWIDPGIGFGKTLDHNLALLAALPTFVKQDYPVLLGASRKSFINNITTTPDPADRLPGSLAVAAYAATLGVGLLRVHDVAETVQAVRVIEAIVRPDRGHTSRQPAREIG